MPAGRVFGRVLLGVSVAALALPSPGNAGKKTHVLAKASELVILEPVGSANTVCGSAGFSDITYVRILPDGSSTLFTSPPPGQVLVVTDLDWQLNSGTPGSRVTFRVFLVNVNNPSQSRRVAESTRLLGSNGSGGGTESFTTGFVVGPDATLCVDTIGGGTVEHHLIRGYLAKDI